jgi:hypothetical protein
MDHRERINGIAERECVAYEKQQNGSIDHLADSQHETPIWERSLIRKEEPHRGYDRKKSRLQSSFQFFINQVVPLISLTTGYKPCI